jgi:hypothetical protein
VSCAAAVGSGLPVGPEGPMIHLGAMVGQGVSMGRSKTFGIKFECFRRFRNSALRRDMITGGASAGVAAAFRVYHILPFFLQSILTYLPINSISIGTSRWIVVWTGRSGIILVGQVNMDDILLLYGGHIYCSYVDG